MKSNLWKIAVVVALIVSIVVVVAAKNNGNGVMPEIALEIEATDPQDVLDIDVPAIEDSASVVEEAAVEREVLAAETAVGKDIGPVQQAGKLVKPELTPDTVKEVGETAVSPKENTAKAASKSLPKLINLGASMCIPCKMMEPIREELIRDYKGKLVVQYIDVSENREAVKKYNVVSIPTLIFCDENGKELSRKIGFTAKDDIFKEFAAYGIEF